MKKLIITIFSLLLTVNILAQQVDYTKPDSLRVVALMKKAVGDKLEVKASGGIRNKEQFEAMVEAGATRIGCSAGMKIMEEFAKEEK